MQIAAKQQKQHTHIITHIFFIFCHSVRAGAERAAGVPALPRSAAAAAASLSRALCFALPLRVALSLSQSALSLFLFFSAASKLVSVFQRVLFSFLQLSLAQ